MSGKYLEFTNMITGEVICTKVEFAHAMGITKYRLEVLLSRRYNGVLTVDGQEWSFVMKYQHVDKRDYIPNGKKRDRKRVYTFNKVTGEKKLPVGDREYRETPDEDDVYTYKPVGNFLCAISNLTGRLVTTSYIENKKAAPVKPMMPAPGETTIIDKILSGEIFINMKIV